ncbi:hypothetical protein ACWEIJ_17025 [Lentzea sp. NPDC004789]
MGAWSFLVMPDEPVPSNYVYDSLVANHRRVAAGDTVVLRGLRSVLGVGIVSRVEAEPASRVRHRCPHCGSGQVNARKALAPRYMCWRCRTTFEEPQQSTVPVTRYTAHFDDGWRATDGRISVGALELVALSRFRQNAIRQLDPDGLERLLAVMGEWVESEVYPFAGAPRTAVENAERKVFDAVAYAASEAVNKGEPTLRRLLLRLLKDRVETDAEKVCEVLESVIGLPGRDLANLKELLAETDLPAIIATAKHVRDRLCFLAGLETVLYDEEPRKQTRERGQLHRILANETWLFGEQYSLVGNDESLTNVARKHLKFLGEDVDLADTRPVLGYDGKKVIPDLVLCRKGLNGSADNLVVELKRPSVVIGADELMQIEKYAHAVIRDSRFTRTGAKWTFVLVGTELDDFVTRSSGQSYLPVGCVKMFDDCQIYVRTWSELINGAKVRLRELEDTLGVQADEADGIEYLRKAHGQHLPPVLSADDAD